MNGFEIDRELRLRERIDTLADKRCPECPRLRRRVRDLQKSNVMLRQRARRSHEVDLFVRRLKGRDMSGLIDDAKVWMDDMTLHYERLETELHRIGDSLEMLIAHITDAETEPVRSGLQLVPFDQEDDQ